MMVSWIHGSVYKVAATFNQCYRLKVMATKNMLIITDASDVIIAASHEDLTNPEVRAYITPASPDHKMYRIADVPEEIANLTDSNEFHRAITRHFQSEDAKVRLTSAAEYFNFITST